MGNSAMATAKILTKRERADLYTKIKQGVPGAYAQLVVSYEFFFKIEANRMIRNYRLNPNVHADIVQAFIVAALAAEHRYNPDLGALPTFMRFRLETAFYTYVAENQYALPLPLPFVKAIPKLRSTIRRLNEAQAHVSTAVVNEETGVSKTYVHPIVAGLHQLKPAHSLSEPVTNHSNSDTITTLGDTLAADEMSPLDGIAHTEMRQVLKEVIASLPPREAAIINRRVFTEEPETLGEVGNDFGVSRERVRQVEVNAIALLKKRLASRGIHSYEDALGT
jgi:RNA polymerase primary sigma factor